MTDETIQITIRTPDTQCSVVDSLLPDHDVTIGDLTNLYYRVCIGLGFSSSLIKDSFANFDEQQDS